jgi:hypothetical protein
MRYSTLIATAGLYFCLAQLSWPTPDKLGFGAIALIAIVGSAIVEQVSEEVG